MINRTDPEPQLKWLEDLIWQFLSTHARTLWTVGLKEFILSQMFCHSTEQLQADRIAKENSISDLERIGNRISLPNVFKVIEGGLDAWDLSWLARMENTIFYTVFWVLRIVNPVIRCWISILSPLLQHYYNIRCWSGAEFADCHQNIEKMIVDTLNMTTWEPCCCKQCIKCHLIPSQSLLLEKSVKNIISDLVWPG